MRRLLIAGIVATMIAAAVPSLASDSGPLQPPADPYSVSEPPLLEPPEDPDAVSQWIVQLAPGASGPSVASGLTQTAGATVTHVYEHVFDGFAITASNRVAEALRTRPDVVRVERARTYHATETGSNGMFRVDAEVTYANVDRGRMADGTPVRIAILDTGITPTHTDLAPNYDPSESVNCITPGTDPIDDQGHGTHVAGIAAAADDGPGLAGAASQARIVVAKVLNAAGSGSDAEVICGIDHIAALAADGIPTVANFSLGDSVTEGPECGSSVMHEAICRLYDAGVIIVAAAGNNAGNTADFVPASYPETIAVSAFSDLNGVGPNDPGSQVLDCQIEWTLLGFICDETISVFSNWGPHVDVAAPGVRILSTDMNGGTSVKSGTSMAAPLVAGIAALALAEDPSLTLEEVRSLLQTTGECPDGTESGAATCVGKGEWLVGDGLGGKAIEQDGIPEPLVNAPRVVAAAAAGSVPDAEPPTQTIDQPSPGGLVAAPVVLSGSALDDVGVAGVTVAIHDIAQGLWWDGAGWVAPVTRIPADLQGSGTDVTWSYSFDPGLEGAFWWAAQATDTSGNVGSQASSSFTVVSDPNPPSQAIEFPGPGELTSAPVVLAGSASDDVGVAGVTVAIFDVASSLWWDGTGWGSAVVRVPATTSGSGTDVTWSYPFDPGFDGAFWWAAQATDTAGNEASQSSSSFTLVPDPNPPTQVIDFPTPGATVSAPVVLAGSASDDVEVAGVTVAIFDITTGDWWNGSGWQTAVARVPATVDGSGTDVTWSYDFDPGFEGAFWWAARAEDASGNLASQSSSSFVIVADPNPPTQEILAPAPGEAVSAPVTLSGSASDDVGVAGVTVAIFDVTSWMWWDGTGWGSAVVRVPSVVAGSGPDVTWEYVFDPGFTGGFWWAAQATDASGNLGSQASSSFTID